ncbi:hypothetical protein JXQ31_08605 [candidate division KSB1 bacterium]|nr:hypothetical protein [candidate division KSB1 bacterium]
MIKKLYNKSNTLTGLIFFILILLVPRVNAGIGINSKFFAEFYSETINFHRVDNNIITSAHALEGVKLSIPNISTLDVYMKQRYGSDANRDYWNNRGEFMLGARLRFFKKIYFAFFYEYIQGRYLGEASSENPNPYGSYFEDTRYGLIFWQGMDMENKHRWKKSFPLSFWNETYADALYLKKNDNNIISFTNIRAGVRLTRVYKTVLDVYAVSYFGIDKNKDFWNNKIEYGIGFRTKPWYELDLSLYIEFLNGSFIDKNGRYENPYDKNYTDRRIGLTFWHGLGF